MARGEVRVSAVNRGRRVILLATGEYVAMDAMLDDVGAETDDPHEAAICVCQLSDGWWIAVDLREFDSPAAVQ